MALNPSQTGLVSSLAPSPFETEVTFTATVVDPVSGDPNTPTAPLGTVQFVADGSFGFGSVSLVPLTAHITAVSASLSTATYTATNNFMPGHVVTIVGFGGGFSQFNGTGLIIATATANSFTITGSYSVQVLSVQFGTATSTNASQCSASTTVLIPGIHTIVASYLGDSTPVTGHTASANAPLSQQIIAVATTSVVEVPGFGLTATYSTSGDSSLPPQATLFAIPSTVAAGHSLNLLWDTLNVAFVRITGDNGVDYQSAPPPGSAMGFDTTLLSTSGSGVYVLGNGFTANITLTLQAYDQDQNPILGLTSAASIVVT